MEFYLQGLTIGLAYVAPIGLQNLFVINSALTQKRGRAYLTALIVTFFDVTLSSRASLAWVLLMEPVPLAQLGVLLVGSSSSAGLELGCCGARLRLIRAGRT